MNALRERHGVRSLLHEGGPTLLAAFVAAGLVDELFITLSPMLAGSGPEAAPLEGPPLAQPVALRLLSLLAEDGFLFARYRVGRA